MKKIILEIDRLDATIIGEYPFGKVSKALSFRPKGYQFTPPFQKGHWDGRIRFLKKGNKFPAGLVPRLQKFLKSLDYQVEIRYTYPLPPAFKKANIRTEFGDKTGRAYQLNAVMKALNQRRAIIKQPTGSGKTLIAGLIIKNLMRPTFFLTDRKVLMHQTYDIFVNVFGRDNVSRLGDGLKGKPRLITVGMVPTLHKMNVNTRKELLSMAEVLILDEVHKAKSKSWNKVLNSCYAIWRIGLTATPEEGGNIMNLEAHTGQIIQTANAKELAEKGYMVLPDIVISRISEPKISDRYDYDQAFRIGIIDNERRNRRIALMAKLLVRSGYGPVLIFSTKLDHLDNIQNWADEFELNYSILTGKDKSTTRKKEIQRMIDGELDVMLTSTIFDEGVDIPNLGSAILAGVGKDKGKLIQRIGRTKKKN